MFAETVSSRAQRRKLLSFEKIRSPISWVRESVEAKSAAEKVRALIISGANRLSFLIDRASLASRAVKLIGNAPKKSTKSIT
jgi:hypothetical protein